MRLNLGQDAISCRESPGRAYRVVIQSYLWQQRGKAEILIMPDSDFIQQGFMRALP